MNNPPTGSSTPAASSTTGRRHGRHGRAGSVHVTELISKRSPTGPPSSPESPTDTQPDGSPLDAAAGASNRRPNSHRRARSRYANLAKISVLSIASLVLCASVVLASMIAQRREGTDTAQRPPPDLQITGARALLPDELIHAASLVTGTAMPDLPNTTNPGANAEPSKPIGSAHPHPPRPDPAHPGPPHPRPAHPGPPHPYPAHPGPAGKDRACAKTELVKRFYQLVLTQPKVAFQLLDTRMPGRDLNTFVQSWDTVAELKVFGVRERGIDVLAVIRMRLEDGSQLQVQQSLEVSDIEPQRIVGARILSAQRMAT